MADFIISPYAISYNSIKNALEKYINDKNVSSVLDVWSDFYTAGAGQTIVELDAAVAAFYAFHFIIGRREAYLPVAQNYSSILGGAETLGYCASRGHNVHLRLTFTPTVTQTLTKWTVVGSYAEYDVVLLDTVKLTKDIETTIDVVIGNSVAQAITITSSDVQQFTFTANDTTDDCRLVLNDTEVPMANNLEEAMDDKYIVLSNSYGSVDVFYLNQNNRHTSYSVVKGTEYGWTYTAGNQGESVPSAAYIYKDIIQSKSIVNDGNFTYTGSTHESNYSYNTQDTLYLQYIQRNNLKYSVISNSTIALDYGEVTDMSLIEDFKDAQSADSVKLGASVSHEMNNVIRARKDYAKYLLQDNTLNLIDTNDHDINPGLMAVTYLKRPDADGNSKLTTFEKEQFMKKLVKVCPDGVANIYLEDPIPVVRTLSITLWQNAGEVLPADINVQIRTILNQYENQLAVSLDLEAIENALEQIVGVKIARVDIGVQPYAFDTTYKLYDVVEVENIPVGTEFQTWKFMCYKIQTKSGKTEPDWSSATSYGDTVLDYNLVWERANKYVSSIPYRWKENDEFNMYNDVSVGYTIYPNSTSYTTPSWDRISVVDGNVTFNKIRTYDYALSSWAKDSRFIQDEYVIFNRDTEYAVYRVDELLSNSGTSTPDWLEAEEINDTIYEGANTWQLSYFGYVPTQEYNAGEEIGIVIDNKLYIYSTARPCNSDTKYSTTKKTGAEANPFDGSEEIKEWVGTPILDPETGEETGEYTWAEGNTIWIREAIIEDYAQWETQTSYLVGTYTQGGNNIFKLLDNTNSKTGLVDWFSQTTDFPEEKEDGNIKWVLDSVTIGTNEVPIAGTTWYPNKVYELGNIIIVSDRNYTYAYNVVHLTDSVITTNNIIYTVSNFTGQTGTTEPEWTYTKTVNNEDVTYSYDNVLDNNILWTKTTNAGDLEWEPNTYMAYGDIIQTDGGYYQFTSVLGQSGLEEPDWTGINNGVVEDNNILWQRIEDSTVIDLKWNEYLKLNYELNPIR